MVAWRKASKLQRATHLVLPHGGGGVGTRRVGRGIEHIELDLVHESQGVLQEQEGVVQSGGKGMEREQEGARRDLCLL